MVRLAGVKAAEEVSEELELALAMAGDLMAGDMEVAKVPAGLQAVESLNHKLLKSSKLSQFNQAVAAMVPAGPQVEADSAVEVDSAAEKAMEVHKVGLQVVSEAVEVSVAQVVMEDGLVCY